MGWTVLGRLSLNWGRRNGSSRAARGQQLQVVSEHDQVLSSLLALHGVGLLHQRWVSGIADRDDGVDVSRPVGGVGLGAEPTFATVVLEDEVADSHRFLVLADPLAVAIQQSVTTLFDPGHVLVLMEFVGGRTNG